MKFKGSVDKLQRIQNRTDYKAWNSRDQDIKV